MIGKILSSQQSSSSAKNLKKPYKESENSDSKNNSHNTNDKNTKKLVTKMNTMDIDNNNSPDDEYNNQSSDIENYQDSEDNNNQANDHDDFSDNTIAFYHKNNHLKNKSSSLYQKKQINNKDLDDLSKEDLIEDDSTIDGELLIESNNHKMSEQELENYIGDIAETVKIGLEHSISILTPWFFKNMPAIYYEITPRAEKIRHLSAVITGHVFETKQTIDLWNRDKSKVTYIGPGGQSEILSTMAQKISDLDLKMGSIYFSKDKLLFLASFFTKDFVPLDLTNKHISLKLASIKQILNQEYPNEQESINKFINNLDNDFVGSFTKLRIILTFKMVHHMQSHEGAHTFFEQQTYSLKRGRISLGMKDASIGTIYQAALALIQREFIVLRNFNVLFEKGYESSILVMHFEIQHKKSLKLNKNIPELSGLIKALRTLGWVDTDDYTQFMKEPLMLSINAANLIRAMSVWTHVQLSKENAYYYSEYKIFYTLRSHQTITSKLIELFRIRFDHSMHINQKVDQNHYLQLKKAVLAMISDLVGDQIARNIFRSCVRFIDNILKTNYYLPTKTGLAFRLDPKILKHDYYPNKPFGIFFIIGRDYRFFQVRWKDISRGGMRIIMTKNSFFYSHALSGLFDEVFDLSFAQQMKNKDIPEGGSKAVLLVTPGGNKSRVVRGAVNALLDLLVESDESLEEKSSSLLKYYEQEEIIYLGPDENMTNDLISWIAHQAYRRGYKYARAFMSSKPGDGINHKEYGVTSEGLNVYLEQTLLYLGINPKNQSFSIKLTGGPSGDVAGNELKILYREYKTNAKVLVIADGSGAAYDPKGLDWQELLRLCDKSLDIVNFDKTKLSNSKDAYVIDVSSVENIKKRDKSFLEVYADIFVPAGGRPYTITQKNWHKFIDNEQKPSCLAIVEGANIFFDTKSRENLQSRGVLIIKDSSANKAGVICSSFETLSSLTLTANEFIPLKEKYVQEVIIRLKQKTFNEASLLFKEYDKNSGSIYLSQLSVMISEQINSVKSMLADEFQEHSEKYLNDPIFKSIVNNYVPDCLRNSYPDRIKKIPTAYMIAIVSTHIASHIVYIEGIDWLKTIAKQNQIKAALTYLNQEKHKQTLIESVVSSNLKYKDQIAQILKNYAARELTLFELNESKNHYNGNGSSACSKDKSDDKLTTKTTKTTKKKDNKPIKSAEAH